MRGDPKPQSAGGKENGRKRDKNAQKTTRGERGKEFSSPRDSVKPGLRAAGREASWGSGHWHLHLSWTRGGGAGEEGKCLYKYRIVHEIFHKIYDAGPVPCLPGGPPRPAARRLAGVLEPPSAAVPLDVAHSRIIVLCGTRFTSLHYALSHVSRRDPKCRFLLFTA